MKRQRMDAGIAEQHLEDGFCGWVPFEHDLHVATNGVEHYCSLRGPSSRARHERAAA